MRKLVAASLVITVVSAAYAARQMPPAPTPRKVYTPEERAARRAAAMQRNYAKTGGFVTAPSNDTRILALVNGQQCVANAWLEEIAASIKTGLQFPVVVCEKRPEDAGLVIEIKENDYPATFITAPESGFAMLNIGKLKVDKPKDELLKTRVTKELWRALVYMLGGGNDAQPVCLMKPVASLSELDALQSICPCPMSFAVMSETAKRFGVAPARITSYRQAVIEGWAPAPTNDIQKAIWDKVHQLPAEPIKIKPETKKVER